MLDEATFKNIQSHQNTHFKFVPGVNCIIGESHQGKSAIMRGLGLAITNNSMGPELVSHWCKNKNGNQNKDISVGIIKGDRELCRIRSPKSNSYTLTGVKDPFTAISSDIPKQVEEFLNMTDVNIQVQDDKPFLLYETPGNAARIINKVVELDIIDRSLSGIRSKKAENTKNIKVLEAQKETVEKSLAKYKSLGDFENVLVQFENEVDARDKLSEEITALSNHLEDMRQLQTDIDNLFPDKIEGIEKVISDRELEVNAFNEIGNQIRGIAQLVESIRKDTIVLASSETISKMDKVIFSIQETRNEKQVLVDKVIGIESLIGSIARDNILIGQRRQISSMEMICNSLVAHRNESNNLAADILNLQGLISGYDGAKIVKEQNEAKLIDLEALMPNKCPTCGSDLKESICHQ